MTRVSTKQDHVAVFAYGVYSHHKPLCAFIARLLRIRPLYITYLAPVPVVENVEAELSRYFVADADKPLRQLIRVVAIDCSPMPFDVELLERSFEIAYRTLAEGKPIQKSSHSEETYEALLAPRMVIIDFFGYEPSQSVRKISGKAALVFTWISANAAAAFRICASDELGGFGDIGAKLETLELKPGDDIQEISDRYWYHTNGDIVQVPGLPAMYDYEMYPQKSVLPAPRAFFFRNIHKNFLKCDGVIVSSSPYLEGDAIQAWRSWLNDKLVIACGPPTPPVSNEELRAAKEQSSVVAGVEAFLDKTLRKYGAHSVIFISFGTVFWPSVPESAWAIFDILLKSNVPFVFAHPSPFAAIPDDVMLKLQASDLVYTGKWLPQQAILRHKATGWFWTHCGHNSIMESLTEGVPLICWPFEADQPVAAINISATLNVGYELMEVRSGDSGLRPILRMGNKAPTGTLDAVRREFTDMLKKMKGDDGAVKRQKAEAIGKAMRDSWDEPDGYCWNEMRQLVAVLDAQ